MTAKNSTLTHARLREVLHYDPLTGFFTWKINPSIRRQAGFRAGWMNKGYIRVRVDGAEHMAHRLAWFYVYGEYPEKDLDHKNTIKSDNRIENLREAADWQNLGNRAHNKNNKSGFKGVFRQKGRRRWTAQLSINGKHTHLGQWDSPEDAAASYDAAAISHYGEFALTNKRLGLIK